VALVLIVSAGEEDAKTEEEEEDKDTEDEEERASEVEKRERGASSVNGTKVIGCTCEEEDDDEDEEDVVAAERAEDDKDSEVDEGDGDTGDDDGGGEEAVDADRVIVMEEGEVAVIPSNIKHSGKTITDCYIIDVFYPVREDYR
jgi:hypothetical protein